jgi:DDE superfamily endonuclease
VTFVGVPYRTFRSLLRRFSPLYKPLPVNPARPGRPVTILPHQALAVVLMFYCSSADTKYLGLIHHLTSRRITSIIVKSEPLLRVLLRHYPDARIQWPSLVEQRAAANRIASHYPNVPGRFGFVDGKNLDVLQPSDFEEQNAQFNGWLHGCFVTGVLVFDSNGLLIWCKHNCPGSWNDSEMSRGLAAKLTDPTKTLPGHGLCADTAFPVGPHLFQHIVSPLKEGEADTIPRLLRPRLVAQSAEITSLRQACEWGMGSIQKPFKRLLVHLPWRKDVRAMRLSNIFRLWNVRVRNTGISQIRESFGS